MSTGNRPLNLKNNELPELRSGNVAYLVGAGLSAASAYKVPTAVGFLCLRFTKHLNGEDKQIDLPKECSDIGKLLAELLQRIERDYGPLDQLNVETVMTDLYVRAFGVGAAWEASDYVGVLSRAIPELRRDYYLLLHYIRERLPALDHSTKVECPLLKKFVHGLRPADSIITLNYDTLIEAYLQGAAAEVGPPRRLGLLESSLTPPGTTLGGTGESMFAGLPYSEHAGIFAKLHGSKDWFTCPNEACVNRYFIQPMSPWYPNWQNSLPEKRTVPRCQQCGSSHKLVIIPPTASKAIEDFPKLGVMWAQAFESFRLAEWWVLIGVSLAPTDFHLSSFLRSLTRGAEGNLIAGDRRRICIVNPDYLGVAQRFVEALAPGTAQAFRRTHGSAPIYVFDSVASFLDKLKEADRRT